MKRSMLKLKPCPFCGGEPEYNHIKGVLWLRCKQCWVGIDPQWYDGDLGVVEASWNRRVSTVEFIENDQNLRKDIARVLEAVARDGLPMPRDLDVALDAILCSVSTTVE